MTHFVVLGAGLRGTPAAFELVPQRRSEDRITVMGKGPDYSVHPSDPRVAIGWRTPRDITVDPAAKWVRMPDGPAERRGEAGPKGQ